MTLYPTSRLIYFVIFLGLLIYVYKCFFLPVYMYVDHVRGLVFTEVKRVLEWLIVNPGFLEEQ